MDPNRCLELINDALVDNDEEEARFICADLHHWLHNGGFAPCWSRYPEATKFFNRYYV